MKNVQFVNAIPKHGAAVHPDEALRLKGEAWKLAFDQTAPSEQRLEAQGHALGWEDWLKANKIAY